MIGLFTNCKKMVSCYKFIRLSKDGSVYIDCIFHPWEMSCHHDKSSFATKGSMQFHLCNYGIL
jgi:hypothetical protein